MHVEDEEVQKHSMLLTVLHVDEDSSLLGGLRWSVRRPSCAKCGKLARYKLITMFPKQLFRRSLDHDSIALNKMCTILAKFGGGGGTQALGSMETDRETEFKLEN